MGQEGARRGKKGQEEARWGKMGHEGARGGKKGQDGAKWGQMGGVVLPHRGVVADDTPTTPLWGKMGQDDTPMGQDGPSKMTPL